MMIIKEINNNNNYCFVHGVMHKHADSTKYAISLHHQYWMYPRTVYYRHGFATKDVLMCDDYKIF
jgi:hypothetical protein